MYLLYFILTFPIILKVLYRQRILTEGDFFNDLCIKENT